MVEVLPSTGDGDGDGESSDRETVSQPSKLIRIATMVKSMLEEVRQASLDEAGRQRLRQIHERSLSELSEVLSADLQEERRGHAAVLRRDADRVGAAHRPGPARRLAGGPVPRDPGDDD